MAELTSNNNFEKKVFLKELENLFNKFPDYSIGQSLYSFTRQQGSKELTGKVSDLLSLSNSFIISRIEKTIGIEDGE